MITGGTGFLGRSIVETAVGRGAHLLVLSRQQNPPLPRQVTHIHGDLATLDGISEHCDLVIHGATESAAAMAADPGLYAGAIAGTRQVLDYAVRNGAKRLLYLSSGAVYGPQPDDLQQLSEEFEPRPQSVYGEAKRASELLCAQYEIETVIARGFAFLGPYIPFDRFAAGNFLRDALERKPITIQGDGTTIRSYMHTDDFAAWCWTLLLHGRAGRAYNVGSETPVTIRELAQEFAHLVDPPLEVTTLSVPDSSRPPSRYVPSTERARTELGLRESMDWRTAVRKTYASFARES